MTTLRDPDHISSSEEVMTAQSQVWRISYKGPDLGRESRNFDNSATPRTRVRKKRLYTHYVYVCTACRKAHRKCIHSRSAESLSDDSDSFGGAKHYQFTTEQVSRIYEPAHSGVSGSVLQFYHKNVAPWLISHDAHMSHVEQKLWLVEVPRICQTESFLCDVLMAVSYSFNNYQHPADFDRSEIFSLTSKALVGMQSRLGRLASTSDAESASILFLCICLLSSLAIHGSAPISTLKMHMTGLSALCSQFIEQLTSPLAVTREFLFMDRNLSRLDVVAQIPFVRRHIMFVEPLLRCIPSEECHVDVALEGSIFHLVLVTNHAIRLWESNSSYGSPDSVQELPSGFERTLFRHFSSYCLGLATFRNKILVLGSKSFLAYVDLIRDIYEQTIFAVLAHSTTTAPRAHKISSLRRDLQGLEADLSKAKLMFPIVRLDWSIRVLSDLQAWCNEQEAEQDHIPFSKTTSRGSSSKGRASRCDYVPPQAYDCQLRHSGDLIPVSELYLAKIELHDYTVDHTIYT